MKNTKHTEMNDSSSDQEVTSQSKRKILTSIGVTSGVLGAGALSQHWVKPVVNSVVLPAHAETSPGATTPAPTTTEEPGPMIEVVAESDTGGLVGDGLTKTYLVNLSKAPLAGVTVTPDATVGGITAVASAAIVFTTTDYATTQNVIVTAPADTPADPTGILTLTASDTVAAESSDYAGVTTSVGFTVVEDDNLAPTEVVATLENSDFVAQTVDVRVTWTAPATNATVDGYIVSSNEATPVDARKYADATSHVFVGLSTAASVTHTFTVTADFASGANLSLAAADVTVGG